MKPSTEFLKSIKIVPLIDTLRMEDIDDSIYFSERYSGYVSNSRLGLINPAQGGSPKAFFEGLAKNAKFSDSLVFGSAVHELILQPESFYLCDSVDRPTAKTGFIADLCYDLSDHTGSLPPDNVILDIATKVDYYGGVLSKSKLANLKKSITPYIKDRATYESTGHDLSQTPIYLDSKSRERLGGVLSSVMLNTEIQNLLHPSPSVHYNNEHTILLDVEVRIPNEEPFILRLKSKLDQYIIDPASQVIMVNDVKTTSKWCKYFSEAFNSFHYYREMGMYGYLLGLCAKKYYSMDSFAIQSNCLVVETMDDFKSCVYKVSKQELQKGFLEFIYLLKLVAFYTKFGYE